MSNCSERNRLKRKGRIQKLLGEGYNVESSYGGFSAYKIGTATWKSMSGVRIYFKPMGTKWVIASDALGMNITVNSLREGVNHIRVAALLVG